LVKKCATSWSEEDVFGALERKGKEDFEKLDSEKKTSSIINDLRFGSMNRKSRKMGSISFENEIRYIVFSGSFALSDIVMLHVNLAQFKVRTKTLRLK
jgi:hypothetical protein